MLALLQQVDITTQERLPVAPNKGQEQTIEFHAEDRRSISEQNGFEIELVN